MWNEIADENDLNKFMDVVGYFHDSCIKELKYISGAFVRDDLCMYPINNCRILRIIIQRQFKDLSMIEMEFEGVKYLKLRPNDEKYTCEILDATMLLEDDCFYWCDLGGLSKADIDSYDGTVICASKFRWRSVKDHMGSDEFYLSADRQTN